MLQDYFLYDLYCLDGVLTLVQLKIFIIGDSRVDSVFTVVSASRTF